MRIRRSRHRDRVVRIFQPIGGLVRDRRADGFLGEVACEAATLNHETVDDTMEQRVVEVPGTNIGQEVGDGLRCARGVEFERDRAVVGVQDDHGLYGVTIVALLISTSCFGTSVGNCPPEPVGVAAILLTTSMPSTTFPNTV